MNGSQQETNVFKTVTDRNEMEEKLEAKWPLGIDLSYAILYYGSSSHWNNVFRGSRSGFKRTWGIENLHQWVVPERPDFVSIVRCKQIRWAMLVSMIIESIMKRKPEVWWGGGCCRGLRIERLDETNWIWVSECSSKVEESRGRLKIIIIGPHRIAVAIIK